MQSVIIPVLKSKSGDVTDANNYRAIAVSTAISKIFESIIANHYMNVSSSDMYQYGFKSGQSTGLCTRVLKRTTNYYTARGSHVFLCFVDFSKAFDKVNYSKLFNMLLDDGIAVEMVKLLAFWYSRQEMCVKWNSDISECFTIANGTRQGGVLSPYLFSRYIRGMLYCIANSHTGCMIGNMPLNILVYADDIVLLSPSWRELQSLIDSLLLCAESLHMSCNNSKTVCMILNPQNCSRIVQTSFSLLRLGKSDIQYVSSFRYLGHIISDRLCDNDDIQREIKNTFIRTKTLIRTFNRCSFDVKCALFRSYCLSLYDVALWQNCTLTCINKFRSCYDKCIKSLFGYSQRYSLTQVLLDTGLPSFDTVMHNSTCLFARSWQNCTNSLIEYLRALRI